MCKHVAAVLYGIGARLDEQPELLFKLRQVDEKDLIAKAGSDLPLSRKGPAAKKVLTATDLSEIFGLEIAATAKAPPSAKTKASMSAKTKARARPAPARRATNAATKGKKAVKGKKAAKAKAKKAKKAAKAKPAAKGKAAKAWPVPARG
jgi:uncharacterized Zn finger protein